MTDLPALILARINAGPCDAMQLMEIVLKANPTMSLEARRVLLAGATVELEAAGKIVRHPVGCWQLPPPKSDAKPKKKAGPLRHGTPIPKHLKHLVRK